jgi:alcohol dehydrogenase class IV
MFELRKFVVPEFIFGVGARHKVGAYARNLKAKRVLIVTDAGVMAAGWLRELQVDLDEIGVAHSLFSDVTANPRDHEVMAGAENYRASRCDVIVALGGGSVIDCAKGIAVVVANGGHILDYEGVDAIRLPGPPLICIPTTAGTAADISQFAIINAVARRTKIAIISKIVVPDVALVDPETTLTLPPDLTAFTGLDALTHAVEAYVSSASSPVSDVHALAAVRGIKDNLLQSVNNPHDLVAREQMMLASLQAGMAFSNASLGATHAMAHSLGGYLDLPHGECNALLLPAVMDFNFHASADRHIRIGEALGLDMCGGTNDLKLRRIVDDIRALRAAAGIDGGLLARGVSRGSVIDLAEQAARDCCIYTNPRRATVSDLRTIYAEAL